jgi:hypothetical protein
MFVKTISMRGIPLFFTLLFFVLYKVLVYLTGQTWWPLLVFAIPVTLLIVNLSLRKRLRYAPWFLSAFNVLLERKKYSLKSDLSADLLFAKFMEVVEESEFRLLDMDEERQQILCGSAVNFWTWGENIYILVERGAHESVVHFTATTLFGSNSLQRNAAHFTSLTEMFEASLTI